MIPFHGLYLMLIMAGTPTVPERIGLEQQLNIEACQANARKAIAKGDYVFVQCVNDGAIVSPALADQPHGGPPVCPPLPFLNQFFMGMVP